MKNKYFTLDILYTLAVLLLVVGLSLSDRLSLLLGNPFLTLFVPYLIGRMVGRVTETKKQKEAKKG